MRSSQLEFEKQLLIGREAEKAVARWLMGRGWKVLPVYDYTGSDGKKAPKLESAKSSESLVCPDLFIVRGGSSRWCEVKYKTHADFTRKTQRKETGIDYRLWNHYLSVERESGFPIWLIFAHKAEDEIRGEALAELSKPERHRIYDGGKMNRSGMVFFEYDALRLMGKLSDVLKVAA